MASSSAAVNVPAGGADIKGLKDKVYEACLEIVHEQDGMVIKQNDIQDLGFDGLEDINTLLQVVQVLINEKYFKVVHDDGSIAWKVRSLDEAKRYRSLTPEQAVVYELIDDAGQEGIWTKTIKTKTNLHDSLFNAAIKHLSGKSLITEMKSVEHPNRKMWIKSSLRPSDRATGGPWYTDGELDEEFINRIMEFLMRGITAHTFYASKIPSTKKPKKIVQNKRLTPEEARAARAATLGPTRVKEETTAITDERSEKRLRFASFLPMPVTYTNYPNVDDLTLALLKSGLTDVVLTAHDIQQLLDIMVYDGMIMRVILGDNIGYKAERNSLLDPDDLGSVLNEAPCGRCPVFDLCEEGGPVGPSNCEYFNEWLGL